MKPSRAQYPGWFPPGEFEDQSLLVARSANGSNPDADYAAPPIEPMGAGSSAARLLEERAQAKPYDALVKMMMMDENTEAFARNLTFYHAELMSSDDDPNWTRSMERELYKYVVRTSNAAEVVSLVCRKSGCEMQLSYDDPNTRDNMAIYLGLPRAFPSMETVLEQSTTSEGRRIQYAYLRPRAQ